jgi:hypothetical protein
MIDPRTKISRGKLRLIRSDPMVLYIVSLIDLSIYNQEIGSHIYSYQSNSRPVHHGVEHTKTWISILPSS